MSTADPDSDLGEIQQDVTGAEPTIPDLDAPVDPELDVPQD